MKCKKTHFFKRIITILAALSVMMLIVFIVPQRVQASEDGSIVTETINGKSTSTIKKSTTLTGHTNISGDLIIESELKLGGYNLAVSGNVLMKGNVDLQGGTFTVSGNFHQANNVMKINQGSLKVNGNYIISETEDQNEHKPCYGTIVMENDNDRFAVVGDFWASSYNTSSLKAGEMSFGGNVTDYRGNTFRCGGTHVVNLVEARNGSVVDLQNNASFEAIRTNGVGQVRFKQLGINKLVSDVVISGDIEDLCTKVDLNGHTMTIKGSVNKMTADIDINGGKLLVTGDFHQINPCVKINKGTFEVEGNYTIDDGKTGSDGNPSPSYGTIKMENEKDYMYVHGTFSASSYNTSSLTAGLMEFKGNVTDYRGNTLRASKDHTAKFSGFGNTQLVDLQNKNGCLENVICDGTSFTHIGFRKLRNSILVGEVGEIWNDLDLNGNWITVTGSVKNISGNIDINGGHFAVNYDCNLENSRIYLNGGRFEVNRNFSIESSQKNSDGTPAPSYGTIKMDNPKDYMFIGGTFTACSYNTSTMSAGNTFTRGDVRDYRGNTIRCSGTHLFSFGGEVERTVQFDSKNSCFQTISTPNTKVQFKTFSVNQLTENVTVRGPIEHMWNKLDLNGKTLIVQGDIEAIEDNIDLNGGTMHVKGNVRQINPCITFNKGLLRVDGNYAIESLEKDSSGNPGPSYGTIKMENAQDTLIVGKNMTTRSYNTSSIKAGKITVAGTLDDVRGNTTGRASENVAISSANTNKEPAKTEPAKNETTKQDTQTQEKKEESTQPDVMNVPKKKGGAFEERSITITQGDPDDIPENTVINKNIIEEDEVDINNLFKEDARLSLNKLSNLEPFEKLTGEKRKMAIDVMDAHPQTYPPGIIKNGKIKFKAYDTEHVKITGYIYAVKEGEDGQWKTKKSTKDEEDLTYLFGNKLTLGKTYWYMYCYYLTIDGIDYCSWWTDMEVGDVYTVDD